METSIFITDLAQQFSLSVVGPSHPLSGWPEQAGADFLIFGLSFLFKWMNPSSYSSHFSSLPRIALSSAQ